jgi:hypothetical protein
MGGGGRGGLEGGRGGGALDAEVGMREFEMEYGGGCRNRWGGWGGLRRDDADGKERGGIAGLQEFLAVAAIPIEDHVGVDDVDAGDEGDGGAGGQSFLDELAAEFGGPIDAGAGWGIGHEGLARMCAGAPGSQKSQKAGLDRLCSVG